MICEKCGKDHGGKCRAHSKRSNKPCRSWPVDGHAVCKMHGAGTPQAKAGAERRLAERAVVAELARMDMLVGPAAAITNPLTELALVAGEVRRFKDIVAARISRLEEIRYEGGMGTEQLRADVALYERLLGSFANTLGLIARLNIDERLVAISERQAEMVMGAIDAALDAADVARDRRPAAKRAAAGHLRLVNTG